MKYHDRKIDRYFQKLFTSKDYLELNDIYYQVLSNVADFFAQM